MEEALIVLTLFKSSVLLLLLPLTVYANEIYITQIGTSNDDMTLDITQDGEDNKVDFSLGGSNNYIEINQKGSDGYIGYTSIWGSGATWGGDIDGNNNWFELFQLCNQSPCGGDRIEFHIQGNNNDVYFRQGYTVTTGAVFSFDTVEYGGHDFLLDIHGDYNTLVGSQRSNNSGHEHDMSAYIYGDYNDVYMRQDSNRDKTMSLTINNDSNDVDMVQTGNASHSASVTLSGSYATDLDLFQGGGTAQSYSLNQSCATTTGCTVSVTQQ
jgi:hypothetical protein